ncbi:hypothetical protein Dsin_001426 [Dipteronia sinensis]|uniref:Homeobox domain-containing protein n=1 Tax=Dipteronia sinensis TaxID=43782 RepID=A0AAE0B587_9ROSI|nr:hypothetical protein Dsin_001426 [Dipteronia sinensis]
MKAPTTTTKINKVQRRSDTNVILSIRSKKWNKCPLPNGKQGKELSREIGLEPLQVKFWFQNKRAQTKTQHERHENTLRRSENESLGQTTCGTKKLSIMPHVPIVEDLLL